MLDEKLTFSYTSMRHSHVTFDISNSLSGTSTLHSFTVGIELMWCQIF